MQTWKENSIFQILILISLHTMHLTLMWSVLSLMPKWQFTYWQFRKRMPIMNKNGYGSGQRHQTLSFKDFFLHQIIKKVYFTNNCLTLKWVDEAFTYQNNRIIIVWGNRPQSLSFVLSQTLDWTELVLVPHLTVSIR